MRLESGRTKSSNSHPNDTIELGAEAIPKHASLLAGLLCSHRSREVSNELEFGTLCQDRRVIGKHANRGLAGSRDIIYINVEQNGRDGTALRHSSVNFSVSRMDIIDFDREGSVKGLVLEGESSKLFSLLKNLETSLMWLLSCVGLLSVVLSAGSFTSKMNQRSSVGNVSLLVVTSQISAKALHLEDAANKRATVEQGRVEAVTCEDQSKN
ncbi:hypothetical protein TNCV_2479901 [Trichonephila clavipes]|nr:hypothetical protein TNCV_2479901 [Trichonephila clavipes]